MRSPLILALLGSALVAQSPLTTTFASNNGLDGNMFDLVASNAQGVTIEYFDVNLDPGTFDLEVYVLTTPGTWVGNEDTAAAWTLAGSALGVVSAGTDQPTLLPIAVCEYIPAGATQAFYVTVSSGTGINYTNGTSVGALYASNADLEYYEGCGKGYPFAGTFQPRIWNGNIYYRAGQGACNVSFATSTSFGMGCGGNDVGDAQYEQFTATSAWDLSSTGQTYIWTGTGYVVTDGATPIVPPTGAPTAFTDDQVQPVALGFTMPTPGGDISDVYLSSNGFLSFEQTTASDLSETVGELLSEFPRLAFLWDDLNPSAGGTIHLESISSSEFHVTFTDVPEFSIGGANTVQLKLFDAGVIEIRYGVCSVADCIVGMSPGNDANDLGGLDYSTLPQLGAAVIETGQAPFSDSMELVSNTQPVIGSNWDLTTSGIDPVSPVAITLIGLPSPVAIPLDGLGATGCVGLLSVIGGSLTGTATAGSATVSVPLPNNPALLNFVAAAQSVGLTLSNLANFHSSNGIEGSLGN